MVLLRTEVEQVDQSTARTLPTRMSEVFAGLFQAAELDEPVKGAVAEVSKAAVYLAETILGIHVDYPLIEPRRRKALDALDQLEARLRTVRPSARAAALGIGW